MPKTFGEMTPAEAVEALGACDQGKVLIERESGIIPLFEALSRGEYSDQVLAELLALFWGSVLRRLTLIRDGHGFASDRTNCPLLSHTQWLKLAGSGGTVDEALEVAHKRADRVRRLTVESRRRCLVADLDDVLAFLRLV